MDENEVKKGNTWLLFCLSHVSQTPYLCTFRRLALKNLLCTEKCTQKCTQMALKMYAKIWFGWFTF